MDQYTRFWYLLHRRAVKAQTSLLIRAVSSDPLRIIYTNYGRRGRIMPNITCADPGIFVRGGGGGGPGQADQKSSDKVFFFFVLSLFYRSQMVNFKEIYHFSRFQRGSNIFQGGGGPTFSGCLFPIETHKICDFPGGVRTPCPPAPPPSGSALVSFGKVRHNSRIESCLRCI